jgi:hypothetical protein
VLAPVATRPENPLRPLVQPRSRLKRSPSANATFQNRWRPFRPASNVTDIGPYLWDAAVDCYAAVGPDRHDVSFLDAQGPEDLPDAQPGSRAYRLGARRILGGSG